MGVVRVPWCLLWTLLCLYNRLCYLAEACFIYIHALLVRDFPRLRICDTGIWRVTNRFIIIIIILENL